MTLPSVLLLTQSHALALTTRQALCAHGFSFAHAQPHPLPRSLLQPSTTLVLYDLPASEIEGRTIYTMLQAEFPRRLGALGTPDQIRGYCFMLDVPMLWKPFTPTDLLAFLHHLATLPLLDHQINCYSNHARAYQRINS
jgi:hypothetical protein